VRVRETAQPVPVSDRQEGMLDYERLDVYQCALQFAALAKALSVRMVSMLSKMCR
jgi:hypothetical protein